MKKRAAIFTLGCRTNQYDGLIIAQSLRDAGYEIVDFSDDAEIYVINTCTVTHRGDADSRKAARNALRRNPEAFIIIAGCYSQWASDSLSRISGIDLIIGNREKLHIAQYLPQNLFKRQTAEIIISNPTFDDSFGCDAVTPIDKSRALLKIQDGCNRKCSYCIVPRVRGNSRSLEKKEVISRIKKLYDSGYSEIVITGVNLGFWGKDRGDSLESLVSSIQNLDGDFRVRLSSIEPMELNENLIDTILHSPRIARHIHIPLQSTCERILLEMGRPNTMKETQKLLEKIKSTDAGWNIGSDLIIGYPGETEADFEEALSNLLKLPVDYFHLFTYSPRKDTPAGQKTKNISQDRIKSRLETLKALDKSRRLRFLKSQLGKPLKFVLEHSSAQKEDIIIGLSDNYIRAKFTRIPPITSGIISGQLVDAGGDVPIAVPE
jgi:threonylcarbamoyladenosine tRNA methylthiotransferase MtaB